MKKAPLEGFTPTDIASMDYSNGRKRCNSRELMEAFLDSNYECVSKPMDRKDLKRIVYNLRHYRKRHIDEFQGVGIGSRDGKLFLYRAED